MRRSTGMDGTMILFENVSKVYHLKKFRKQVLNNINFAIHPGESVGICGANGAGKSTLMRLISGVELPTSGKVTRTFRCSWPIGYSSCFQVSLTGADNLRFIARIYNRNAAELQAFVEDFAQLGPYLYKPIYTYSAGMTARLAFGLSLAINFDCYLVDEVTAAGDERFSRRCEEELHVRRASGTLVMVSHSSSTLRQYCTRGAVLYGGDLTFYDSIDEAIDVHQFNQLHRQVA